MTHRTKMLTRANTAVLTYAESIGLIFGTEDFFEHLCGGKAVYTLHPRGDINDAEDFGGFDFFFPDEEADPMHVVFQASGELEIHPGDFKYVMLTAEHMKLLAFAMDLVKPILNDCTDEMMEAEEEAIAAEEAAIAAADEAADHPTH